MGNVVGLSAPHRWKTVREFEASECCGHHIAVAQAEDGAYAVLIVSDSTFEIVGSYAGTPEGLVLANLAADVADTTLAMHTFIQPA